MIAISSERTGRSINGRKAWEERRKDPGLVYVRPCSKRDIRNLFRSGAARFSTLTRPSRWWVRRRHNAVRTWREIRPKNRWAIPNPRDKYFVRTYMFYGEREERFAWAGTPLIVDCTFYFVSCYVMLYSFISRVYFSSRSKIFNVESSNYL